MQEARHKVTEQDQLARLRSALAAAGNVAYEWDFASDRMFWFAGAAEILGLDIERLAPTGDAYLRLIKPEDLAARLNGLSRLRAASALYDAEYRLAPPVGSMTDGDVRVHDRARAEMGPDGRPFRLTGILRRLADFRSHRGVPENAAGYDMLTGHFNRARLREALDHALSFGRRYGSSGAFLAIGVDNLTMINQALGHEAADSVLIAVADRIDQSLRTSDVIGRVDGDKFGAVLSHVAESELETATEKILEAIRRDPVETAEGPVCATVSIGAVAFPGANNTSADVMMRADVALRKAKQAGRDCANIYSFSEAQLEYHKGCIVIAESVQRAMSEDRMRFAYQPIVQSDSRRPRFYECLLRIVQPDGTVVTAGDFMPVVEELGLIRSVDRAVLRRGVDELAGSPEARIAINVSGLTTTDRSWMRSAVALLQGRPDYTERLFVEITETAGLEDLEACCRFVRTLRDLGCGVALDDFGAGYTSFRHLKQLAVNQVKIDGSFVRRIGENPDNLVFIRTLIDLARTFDIETVAECVETAAEADLLLNEGIDYMQGYAFGRPELEAPWTGGATSPRGRAAAPTPAEARKVATGSTRFGR